MTPEKLKELNPHVAAFESLATATLKDLTARVKEAADGKTERLDDWDDICRKVTDLLRTCIDRNDDDPEINEPVRMAADNYLQAQSTIWGHLSRPGFADALCDVVEDTEKLKRTETEYVQKANRILDEANKNDIDGRRLLVVLGLPVSGPFGAIGLAFSEFYTKLRQKHLDDRYEKNGLKIRDDKVLAARYTDWTDYADLFVKGIGIADNVKDAIIGEVHGKTEKVYRAVQKLADLVVDYAEDIDRFLEASGSPEKADKLRKLIDQLDDIGEETLAETAVRLWIQESKTVVEEYREQLKGFLELSSQLRAGVFLRNRTKLTNGSDAETMRMMEDRTKELSQLFHRLEQDVGVEIALMQKRLGQVRSAASGNVLVAELLDDPDVMRRVEDSGEINIEELLNARDDAERKK